MHSKMVAMIKEELAIIEKGSCTYIVSLKRVRVHVVSIFKKALAAKQNRLQDL